MNVGFFRVILFSLLTLIILLCHSNVSFLFLIRWWMMIIMASIFGNSLMGDNVNVGCQN
jgi:hypothetical protein